MLRNIEYEIVFKLLTRMNQIEVATFYLSIWSSISCRTSRRLENCSRLSEGFIVCGRRDGMTRVAIRLTDSPFFLLLIIR